MVRESGGLGAGGERKDTAKEPGLAEERLEKIGEKKTQPLTECRGKRGGGLLTVAKKARQILEGRVRNRRAKKEHLKRRGKCRIAKEIYGLVKGKEGRPNVEKSRDIRGRGKKIREE